MLNDSKQDVNFVTEKPAPKLEIGNIIKVLLSRWYWIVGCIVLALIAAYIYLLTTPPAYTTLATVKLEHFSNELTKLADIGQNDGAAKIESETYVLQSPKLIRKAVENLDYPVSYFHKGKVMKMDLYPAKPFLVDIIERDTAKNEGLEFTFQRVDEKSFDISYNHNGKETTLKKAFNQIVSLPGCRIRIRNDKNINKDVYYFRINSVFNLQKRISKGIKIAQAPKVDNIMLISFTDSNPQFAADALNALLNLYAENNAQVKRQAATQTVDFVDEQLAILLAQVRNSQGALVNYKQSKSIIDLNTSASTLSAKLADFESKIGILKIQGLGIDQLQNELKQNSREITLNLGIEGETGALLSTLIAQINGLIQDRNEKLKQFNDNSTIVQGIDRQINTVREAINNNVRLLKERNDKTINYLNAQAKTIRGSLSVLPTDERNLFNLQTDFDLNQKIYSFLEQKKLESQISRAAIVSDVTVLEAARPNFSPVSPVSNEIYRNGFLVGLLTGIGLIFLKRLLNPYIYDRAAIDLGTDIPVLGALRRFPLGIKDDNKELIESFNPKSGFAESLRSLRTNLSFMASDKESKVICITSAIAGEGKSFVSLNLALTFSMVDKKVVLLAADLRRSRLDRTFNVHGQKGLSEYLANQAGLEDIIIKMNAYKFDFINSGVVPPNPSELLYSEKMSALLVELKKNYDYVIVDTAPVGLISDAIPIMVNADVNIFVIRSGVSRLPAIKLPESVLAEFDVNSPCIVLNAFENNPLYSSFQASPLNNGYNSSTYSDYYYYSSPYNEEVIESKSWFKRIFNKK